MRRPFDWERICAADLTRPYPAVAGKGRGRPLSEAEALRKLGDRRLAQEASVK